MSWNENSLSEACLRFTQVCAGQKLVPSCNEGIALNKQLFTPYLPEILTKIPVSGTVYRMSVMSNAVTFQPNRLSMRYSAEKQSEEDLIKTEETEEQNDNKKDPENTKIRSRPERITDYKEDTCCDYMLNICQCTSWLCANLVSSVVLCFENCIDAIHTCKCSPRCCCDVCGGSEDSLEDNKITQNTRFNDLSENYEDEFIFCQSSPDIEMLPDSGVSGLNEIPEIHVEEIGSISNSQNQSTDSDNIEKSSL